MRFKELLTDDDAVSPVIGVILMVAITVILAAVIASFVLGLGPGEAAPTANFDIENETGNDDITITHDGGDSILADQLLVDGDNVNTTRKAWSNWQASGTIDGSSAVVTGDRAVAQISTVGDGWTVRVIWESEDGGSSQTLAEQSG